MEKKTIGGFIAALRKANGMTQKELAERLNVSDKTVSRWERDDGAPDLSVIPAIAEIFDVTCDELLRGQRKSPAERAEIQEAPETSPKGEQQKRLLLKSSLGQYQSRTYIAMGVSLVGLNGALICNLAFLRAVLGFFVGAIFYGASTVCQAIFLNQAFLAVADAEVEETALSGYRRKVISLAEKSIGLTAAFLGFTFPMVWMDAYVGLTVGSLLMLGGLGAAVVLTVYAVTVFFVNGSLMKKGVYGLPEKEAERYDHNRKLKQKYGKRFAVLLCLTLLLHAFGFEALWSTHAISGFYGITFHDFESFAAYMEQDIPSDIDYYSGTMAIEPEPESQVGEPVYYDQYGNEITEEEALTRTIEDAEGNVLCSYIQRNESVSLIRYSGSDGNTALPIQVITKGDWQAAARLSSLINAAYCVLYPVELLAAVLAYFKKRMK